MRNFASPTVRTSVHLLFKGVFSAKRHRTTIILLPLLIVVFFVVILPANRSKAATGILQQINYQARLLNSAGAVVPDGTYNIRFKIYQDGTGTSAGNPGGTLKWTELWQNSNTQGVTVTNGYFAVQLGSICVLSGGSCQGNTNTAIDFNQDTLWLSVDVGGTSSGASPTYDGEMLPMRRLSASPYALNAGLLGGLSATQFLQLAPNAVQADGSTNNSIFVNKTGASGNIVRLQNAGTDVFLLSKTGGITTKTTTDTANALQIQSTAGSTVLDVDTTNRRLGVNTSSPSATLTVSQSSLTPGTVSNSASSANVTGTSTTFLTSFQPGDTFTITSSGNTCIVKQITSDTALVCTVALASLSSGSAYSFTQQTRLSVGDNGRTTVGGTLYVTNPAQPKLFGVLTDPSDGKFKIVTNTVGAPNVGVGGTDSGNVNQVSASKFNSGSGGQINSLSVYFPSVAASPNNHVKVAVYADSSGTPTGTPLATSNSTVAIAAAWTNVPLTSTITLTPNTTYWFAFNVDSASTSYRWTPGTANSTKYSATGGANFTSSPFPTGSSVNVFNSAELYSIYASYLTVTDQSTNHAAVTIDDNGNFLLQPNYDGDHAVSLQSANGTELLDINTYDKSFAFTGALGVNNLDTTIALTVQATPTATTGLAVKNTSGTNVASIGGTGVALFQNSTNSTAAFKIQASGGSGATLLTADTTNNRIQVGSSTTDATVVPLILDSYNTTDPSGVAGAMYYSTSTNSFRCFENSAWVDCVGSLKTANTTASSLFTSTSAANFSISGYTPTIPANYCKAGRAIHVIVNGTYSNANGAASRVLTLAVLLGSTQVGSSIGISIGANATDSGWGIDFYITCNGAPSATAAVQGEGWARSGTTSGVNNMQSTSTTTIDTTSAQQVNIQGTWNGTLGSATIYQFIVQAL